VSQRPYLGMRDAKLPIELIETRYVRDAFKAIQSRPIGKDARGTAQLMRFAWFRPVHSKVAARAGGVGSVDGAQATADQEP